MNWKIFVKSKINKGSKFYFNLPLKVRGILISSSTKFSFFPFSDFNPTLLNSLQKKKNNNFKVKSPLKLEKRISKTPRENNLCIPSEHVSKSSSHIEVINQISAYSPNPNPFSTEYLLPFVLIVDDNDLNRYVLKSQVYRKNAILSHAINGKIAVDIMKKEIKNDRPYYLLFMDLEMPIMNGFQATKAILEIIPPIKKKRTFIIACTANKSDSVKVKCREIGMIGFLSIPVTAEKLQALFKIIEDTISHNFGIEFNLK